MSVLLLRAPASDGPDRYETTLQSHGYNPVSVAALETCYVNMSLLKEVVSRGPLAKSYNGVVITSSRGCEAWRSVALQLVENDPVGEQDEPSQWSSVPFYVVGEATSRALRDIRDTVGDYPFVPLDIRGATETGTSERLARFILDDIPVPDSGVRRLLYLTGDKNRDTLPGILGEAGVELESLQVYETISSRTLGVDIDRALKSTSRKADSTGNDEHRGSRLITKVEETIHPDKLKAGEGDIWWIIFFAPSEAEYTMPHLKRHFELASIGSTLPSSSNTPKIASIGPTTARHLTDSMQLRVNVISSRPKPDALVEVMKAFDASSM